MLRLQQVRFQGVWSLVAYRGKHVKPRRGVLALVTNKYPPRHRTGCRLEQIPSMSHCRACRSPGSFWFEDGISAPFLPLMCCASLLSTFIAADRACNLGIRPHAAVHDITATPSGIRNSAYLPLLLWICSKTKQRGPIFFLDLLLPLRCDHIIKAFHTQQFGCLQSMKTCCCSDAIVPQAGNEHAPQTYNAESLSRWHHSDVCGFTFHAALQM